MRERHLCRGRAWKYGDNVDTDQLFPFRFAHLREPSEAAQHLLENLDPQFAKEVSNGDFLVAGKNFGIGSIRGGVHLAMQHLVLGGIIAESFSRAFFRYCISQGILMLEYRATSMRIEMGDQLEVNFATGQLRNLSRHSVAQAEALPASLFEKALSRRRAMGRAGSVS